MKIIELLQTEINIINYVYDNLNNNPLEKSLYRIDKFLLVDNDKYFLKDDDIDQNNILINKLFKYEKNIINDEYLIEISQNILLDIIILINKIKTINGDTEINTTGI